MADRGLSREFLDDLLHGPLTPLLDRVKADDTLHLAIRNEYVNVYYRGGSLMRVGRDWSERRQSASYPVRFDERYFTREAPRGFASLPKRIRDEGDCLDWVQMLGALKQEMDLDFAEHPKLEREYQQLVARSNNRRHAATATDYFIIDIEYAEGEGRFDMIAARWESSGASRKSRQARLALIEMKYGDGAVGGTAGIAKHLRDMNAFAFDPTLVARIRREAIDMFEQQLELQTMHAPHSIKEFSDESPEYILFLMDHDPDSSKLRTILEDIGEGIAAPIGYELKFSAATFMGFGLFKENVFTLTEFQSRMKAQIHSKDAGAHS